MSFILKILLLVITFLLLFFTSRIEDFLLYLNFPLLIFIFIFIFTVSLSKFGFAYFFKSFSLAIKSFSFKKSDIESLINLSVKLSIASKKRGLLSLENFKTKYKFLNFGIQLLVDGHDVKIVQNMMKRSFELYFKQYSIVIEIFKAMHNSSIIAGIIYFLFCSIYNLNAFNNFNEFRFFAFSFSEPILGFLYGIIIAHIFIDLIIKRLNFVFNNKKKSKLLIIDLVNALQDGKNPRVIYDMLQCYLPYEKRKDSNSSNINFASDEII